MKMNFKTTSIVLSFLWVLLAAIGCQTMTHGPAAPSSTASDLGGVATAVPAIVGTVLPGVASDPGSGTPVIPDPNLRQAVMETMETATPNATVTIDAVSLGSLTNLVADNNSVPGRIYPGWVSIAGPVTSLQGLENCTNLQNLYLESDAVTDLKPLAALTKAGKLKFLDVDYNNGLGDLSPLSGMSSLKGLEIRSGAAEGDQYYAGALSDLGPVSTLTNLYLLEFSAQPINSLNPLSTLSGLQQLYMIDLNDGNGPNDGDLSAFQNLTSLQVLYAESNNLMDITDLGGLSQLKYANLNNNSISDVTPLGGWSSATTVILAYNGVFGALPALPNLGNAGSPLYLDLSNNSDYSTGDTISDITQLNNVPGLGASGGAVLNITNETQITPDQTSKLQSNYPQLTIVGP